MPYRSSDISRVRLLYIGYCNSYHTEHVIRLLVSPCSVIQMPVDHHSAHSATPITSPTATTVAASVGIPCRMSSRAHLADSFGFSSATALTPPTHTMQVRLDMLHFYLFCIVLNFHNVMSSSDRPC